VQIKVGFVSMMRIRYKNVEIEVYIADFDDIKIDFYNSENRGIVPDSPRGMKNDWSFTNQEDTESFEELIEFLEEKQEEYGPQYYTEELEVGGVYELINGDLERIGNC